MSLTEEKIKELVRGASPDASGMCRLARAIEAAVREELAKQEPVANVFSCRYIAELRIYSSQVHSYLPLASGDSLYAAPVVPDGMVLVPMEPTEKMILAGDGENHMTVPTEYVADIWKAMIAAAQGEA